MIFPSRHAATYHDTAALALALKDESFRGLRRRRRYVERRISARVYDQPLGKRYPARRAGTIETLKDAALADLSRAGDTGLFTEARPMMVQSLLRHAMAEAILEGVYQLLDRDERGRCKHPAQSYP
jgi:hypothetical protein